MKPFWDNIVRAMHTNGRPGRRPMCRLSFAIQRGQSGNNSSLSSAHFYFEFRTFGTAVYRDLRETLFGLGSGPRGNWSRLVT